GYYARGRGGVRGRWHPEELPQWDNVASLPHEGVCFYEKVNFAGRYFCAPRGATFTSLPDEFEDKDKPVEDQEPKPEAGTKPVVKTPLKIRSIQIFRTDVRLFQSRDFRGRSMLIRANVPRLSDVWRETIASLRVF